MEILYFGADQPWHVLQRIGFRRRNACLLREFARHPAVKQLIVVTPTTRNYALRQASWWRQLFGLGRHEKIQDLFVFGPVPGQRWVPAIGWLNGILMRWLARRVFDKTDGRQLIRWCYWPSGFELSEKLKLPGRLVFDSDHNLIHDENQSAGSSEEVRRCLEQVAMRAELVVSASRSMLAWLRQNGVRRCARLRNGVDPARFGVEPRARNPHRPPHIGYVGVLSRWVDLDLLGQIAAARPDWKFTVAGHFYRASAPAQFERLGNVEVAGEYQPEELASLLRSFDVALSLYRPEAAGDVDSMKLFEYLAGGVPVVATRLHRDMGTDFDGLLEFADNAAEFVHAIEGVLRWDEVTRRSWDLRRRIFVERNTWSARADQTLSWINAICGKCGHSTSLARPADWD